MKIAIIGFGRMGKEAASVAKARGHEVVTIDKFGDADFSSVSTLSLNGVDVAIDFSSPESAIENASLCNKHSVNLVMGTTGWYSEMEKMKKSVKGIGFIWSGNFSIGVNAFFRMLRNAAGIMDKLKEYDVAIVEHHHAGKGDSPSGTAKMLSDIILEKVKRKKRAITERLDRKIAPEEIHVSSVRIGSVPGTHAVIFDSPVDTIELVHTARGRSGFASGAVMAAEWINGKKGFYTINDLMDGIIGGA